MHEDDSGGGGRTFLPAGPSGQRRGKWRGKRWVRRMVVHLTVAAVSAVAGAGATVVTQHVMASGTGAAVTPRAAAAEQPEPMNDQAVYKQVEPGVVDVT